MLSQAYQELESTSLWVRRKVLEMAVSANSGHVSTAMSQTDLLVALYFGGILTYDPKNPKWKGRDRFVLSKGHGAIGLYPILAHAGFFPEEWLSDINKRGSFVGGNTELQIPGVEYLSWSMGHGLSIATGIAQALLNDGKDNLVFCMVGDAELHEGSNWEAMLNASWRGLGNLVVIVDRNQQGTLGKTDSKQTTRDGIGLEDLADKFESFGFDVTDIDGHSFRSIFSAFENIREGSLGDQPACIIAHTRKGRGLTPMEDKRGWHWRTPVGEDLGQCWKDLGVVDPPTFRQPGGLLPKVDHILGMRDRFFNALFEDFKSDRNMVLITADCGAPALDQFSELLDQYYQVGVAEQEMIGMAAGLAIEGKRVFCYALAPFVTARVHEFVKLDVCAMNLPIHLIGVGVGYAYDIMGPTHHTVEDIAIMRVLPNMTIYSPADGSTAAAIVDKMVVMQSPSYIRLDRGGLKDLYSPKINLIPGFITPKGGHEASTKIVATGIMVHQGYEVCKELPDCSVVDIHRLKPVDDCLLLSYLTHDTERIVILEEHLLAGGLGSIIAELFVDNNVKLPLLRIGVPDCFTFDMGGRDVIWQKYGLDVDSIVRRIKEWRGF